LKHLLLLYLDKDENLICDVKCSFPRIVAAHDVVQMVHMQTVDQRTTSLLLVHLCYLNFSFLERLMTANL